LAQIRRFLFLFSTRGATRSPQRSLPCVGGANFQADARAVRPDPVPSVDIQSRRVAAVDPRLASVYETLRPPMPVGTASPEIK
jgi:hypothetical protein